MRLARQLFALILASIPATIAGCGGSDETIAGGPALPNVPEARSKAERLAADATPASVATLVHSDTAFALDLLHAVHPDGNFFYSPQSLSMALAMTYAGAAGNTKDEMQTVLHFSQPDPELHAAFNTLDQALASRGKNAKGKTGEPFRLSMDNALWARNDMSFQASYLDTLAQSYGAGVKLVDFAGDLEASRQLINAWVNAKTNEKIPELLHPDDLDAQTVFVLTNTIYFNASWKVPFKAADTSQGSFTKLDGSTVTVPLMHGGVGQAHAQGDGWQAAEIDYDGSEVSMLVIVPEPGTFTTFEAAFDVTRLEAIESALEGDYIVSLTLPKLRVRNHLNLEETLGKLGMPAAFSSAADFSAMCIEPVFIQHVIHEAFVDVDEAGTEAAAASAVVGGKLSIPKTAVLDATSPFFFVIRDKQTGALVFVGRVVDPSV